MAGVEPLSQPIEQAPGTLGFMLRALRHRNYRLFCGGQIVSLTGTWITLTATSWLVYRLTGSAMLLGVVGFAAQFPAFLLTPFAGIFVDRWNRHRLLIATQTLSMIQSFLLAVLTLTGTITIPRLIALSVLQGMVNAFDMPGRQAFAVVLVEDKRDLGNAIALNSSMFNTARLVGPSIAGAVIAAAGEGWCFFIDGVSFLAVIGSLVAMRVPPMKDTPKPVVSPLAQFMEGWRYAYDWLPIRAVISLVAFVCLVGMPYMVLLPVVAGTVFHGGANTLGFLMTASGGGALLGALWLASRRSPGGLSRLIPIAAGMFGSGLMAFALSRVLWLSLLLLVVTSFGFMVLVAASNTLLQTIVEDSKRGRVMSFFLMAYFGTTPLGSLLAGWLSESAGAPLTLGLGGAACVAGAAWFAMSRAAIDKASPPILAKA
jgi:MFS family permease